VPTFAAAADARAAAKSRAIVPIARAYDAHKRAARRTKAKQRAPAFRPSRHKRDDDGRARAATSLPRRWYNVCLASGIG
jgi:hypothetical protein